LLREAKPRSNARRMAAPGMLRPASFREEDLCQCLAVETRQPVIISWGQPSWEGVVICFTPDGERQLIALSGFLMRWASVNTLTKAISAARSARWEHGEIPKIPNLRVVT